MASFNEEIAHSFTAHAVDMQRVTAGLRNKVMKQLRALEAELVGELRKRNLTTFQRNRYDALLRQTRDTISSAYKEMRQTVQPELKKVAQYASEKALSNINTLANVELASVALSPEKIMAVTSDALIEGAPTAVWWTRAPQNVERKFADTVRMGLMRGEPNDAIVRMVRQQVMLPASRGLDALVRSSVATVNNLSLLNTFESNPDVIDAIQQRSILDSRTTIVCRAYSGKAWRLSDKEPIGHSLPFNGGPPRHWSCRSVLIPVISSFQEMGNLITGGRPAKNAENYFKSRLKDLGMSDEEIGRAVMGAQASMDGQVSAEFDYQDWLETKSAAFQKKVLGPARYELWKQGRIKSFDQLVTQDGIPKTIDELQSGQSL